MKVVVKYSDGSVYAIDAVVVRFYGNGTADIETVNGIVWSITAANIEELKQRAIVGLEPLVFVNAVDVREDIDW